MCRSNGSRVDRSELCAGRVIRNLIVVALAGSSDGRSPSVFTVHRSTPHATRPVAADVRGGCGTQAATAVASVTSATPAPTRRRVPIRSTVCFFGRNANLSSYRSPQILRLLVDFLRVTAAAAWRGRGDHGVHARHLPFVASTRPSE